MIDEGVRTVGAKNRARRLRCHRIPQRRQSFPSHVRKEPTDYVTVIMALRSLSSTFVVLPVHFVGSVIGRCRGEMSGD